MISADAWAKLSPSTAAATPLTAEQVEGVAAGYIVTVDGNLRAAMTDDAYASASLLKDAGRLLRRARRAEVGLWWRRHGLAVFDGNFARGSKGKTRSTFRLTPVGREFCELMVAGR